MTSVLTGPGFVGEELELVAYDLILTLLPALILPLPVRSQSREVLAAACAAASCAIRTSRCAWRQLPTHLTTNVPPPGRPLCLLVRHLHPSPSCTKLHSTQAEGPALMKCAPAVTRQDGSRRKTSDGHGKASLRTRGSTRVCCTQMPTTCAWCLYAAPCAAAE